jgi:hypothetical protein
MDQQYGVIVLLDALGIQNSTIEESRKFIQFLDDARNIEPYIKTFVEDTSIYDFIHTNPPEVRTFGDTFLIAWSIPEDVEIMDCLHTISTYVSFLICEGLKSGFLLRGAISIGEYIQSKNTLIGPAVTDAAGWYEEADWFGCITTPACTQYINSNNHVELFERKVKIGSILVEYDIPFKGNRILKLWCCKWPIFLSFFSDSREIIEIRNFYFKCTARYQIPKGTEQKYYNAEKFVMKVINLEFKSGTTE